MIIYFKMLDAYYVQKYIYDNLPIIISPDWPQRKRKNLPRRSTEAIPKPEKNEKNSENVWWR